MARRSEPFIPKELQPSLPAHHIVRRTKFPLAQENFRCAPFIAGRPEWARIRLVKTTFEIVVALATSILFTGATVGAGILALGALSAGGCFWVWRRIRSQRK